MIIALVNQKGGCAKSVTSVHLAYWLREQEYSVRLIDADAQQTSSIWCEALDEPIDAIALSNPDDVLEQLPILKKDVDYLIVDGPAGLSEITRSILLRTDFALVPCQPTGVDLRSAADALRLIAQAQSVRGGPPQAAVFLSRAVKGTRLLNEARELLEERQVDVLDSIIYQRQAVADTFGQDAVIWQLSGKGAKDSGKEFAALFDEVMGEIAHG